MIQDITNRQLLLASAIVAAVAMGLYCDLRKPNRIKILEADNRELRRQLAERQRVPYVPPPPQKPATMPRISQPVYGNKSLDAWIMACHFVKKGLRSPGTVKWPANYEPYVKHIALDVYDVNAWVDSQNAFGALGRVWQLPRGRVGGAQGPIPGFSMSLKVLPDTT